MNKLTVLAFIATLINITAKSQNVGIGTNAPTEKLEVNGNLRVNGNLNLSGSTGSPGQVLISQGNNPPTWSTPASLVSESAASQQIAEASPELFSGDIVLKSAAVADKWYDGVGLVSFRDTLFVFGGWYNNGSSIEFSNMIRYSKDDGASWALSSATLPFYGHAFVYFKSPDGWLYILGSDNNNQTLLQTVWRTKDMRTFTVMTSNAGWGSRTACAGWADDNNNIYLAGGQTTYDVTTGPNDIWKSSDGGATWTRIANNVSCNGEYFLGQNICNQARYFNGRVYVMGGGIAGSAPNDTYSKKVYSASISNLSLWKRESDLPYTIGRRYISTEVWDGKLWVWSGNNATEGNVRSICYMDNSGTWHDFKYTYTDNNPSNLVTTTHAAGIAVHKDMLYRVLGNFNNDAYAIKRSSYVPSINVRDTIKTKSIVVSSMQGSGTRLALAGTDGELKSSTLTESDLVTTSYNFGVKSIANQSAAAQSANMWITGRGLFGGGADAGKTIQVTGDGYITGLLGLGTSVPSSYLAGVPGLAVFGNSAAGISIANSSKYWLSFVQGTDLNFFEGGVNMNRLSIKSGGVVTINSLSGTGTRMVITDANGNLSAQTLPIGESNTASNLGISSFGLFKQKVGTDLQFRSLAAVTDGGVELVSNTNDVQLKNSAYAAYGKVEVVTGDATPNVIIKTISPTNNSVGTLEVDMVGISASLDAISGKKYVRYKKLNGLVTVVSVTDIAPLNADLSMSSASWTVTGSSGNLEIKVTGISGTTVKWKPVYKLNEVY